MRLLLLTVAIPVLLTAQPDASVGKRIFESQCALCHGQTGGGGRGPSLNRAKLAHAADDDALRTFISQGGGDMPGAWQLHPDELAGVAAYVRSLGAMPAETLPGDPVRGAAVFTARGCPACHIAEGRGEGFGPELTAVGARRNSAFLRQTILKPASSLPPDFQYVNAVPATGPAVRGVRVNEDSFTIQLRDPAGRYHSFRKAELKELTVLHGQTPMPSYEGRIPAAELDDLIAYLAALKGKL
jgi:cytochrome c oxidase cbb3-type subunit III